MGTFQDLFSNHAACYAEARPTYPSELFKYLAGLAPAHRLAWDVGTGNGQAAIDLARHFDRVIATDASAAQLAHAHPHERVAYHVVTAEEAGPDIGLHDGGVDLVTVAQALHWFNFDAFYANVRSALKPAGIIAAWSYGMNYVSPAVDAVIDRLYEITGPYWAAGRKWIDERYETIPFPFERIEQGHLNAASSQAGTRGAHTAFECRQDWTLPQFVAYLRSWSGTQRYMAATARDPLLEVAADMQAAWGNPAETRTVHWPIYLLVGRNRIAVTF